MIAVIVIGFLALVALAVVVGTVDAAHAARWREVARGRRARWERRERI